MMAFLAIMVPHGSTVNTVISAEDTDHLYKRITTLFLGANQEQVYFQRFCAPLVHLLLSALGGVL